MFRNLFAIAISLSLVTTALAHSVHAPKEMQQDVKTVKITDTIYMLQGSGGNIGVSNGKDGLLIIDDDVPQVTQKIADALKQFSPNAPKFIMNTHWHFDHVGGNVFFGKAGSTIISHLNVRKRVMVTVTMFGQEIKALEPAGWPMLTFEQSMSVHFNGDELNAVHYPTGHTDGDSIIFIKGANIIHMGDQFFNGFFPFVDLDSGGNVEGYIKNVGSVLAKIDGNTKVIPGHGPLTDKAGLQKFYDTLVESVDIIRKGMKKKKTLDQLKKEALPDKFKSWGSGFIKTDQWIETVYKSYGGDKKK